MLKFILAGLLLSGCMAGPDLRLEGDWKPEEIDVVQKVLDQWCDKSGGDLCGKLDYAASATLTLDPHPPGAAAGVTYMDKFGENEIVIYTLRESPVWMLDLEIVVLHEVGHHLRGKGHIPTVGDTMSPCNSRSTELTVADLYQELDDELTCVP